MGAAAMLVGVEMVEAAEAEVRKGWAKRVAVAETTAEAAGAETEGVQSAAGMGA